jgi:acetolactate synthase-1/2/3 large subunit
MNGAETIIDFLMRKGVKHTFGYPGGPVIVLFDAIYKMKFPNILTRHEQGAAHAAEGYAKVSGLPGVMLATSGPGATNLVTGLADAYLDSVPVLAITGAVARSATGTDAFQEADITGITQPVTKYNYLVMKPEELLPALEEAWNLTTEGRPGPVLVNVPKDILASPINDKANVAQVSTRHRPARIRTRAMTGQVYDAIRKSSRPLLLAGGGCVIARHGTEDLKAFAEAMNLPVATTLMGKGAIAADHPLYLGNLGMHGTPQANTALGNCDLLLAVGSRFSDRIIGDPALYTQPGSDRTIIHVDIDLAEIGKNIRTDIEIEDDAAAFFEAMLAAKPEMPAGSGWQDWLDKLRAIGRRYAGLVQDMYQDTSPLRPQYVVHQTAEKLKGQNPIVVTDVGQHQMFAAQHYPVESPRSFITSGGLGTMGFGLPAAIGASSADPGRTTILFAGDGGFQMTIQELGTLAQQNLPVKMLIMDNSCLGMVRQWQELFFDKRYGNTLLENNPDFVKIADAYGIPGGRAFDGTTLLAELDKAMGVPGPYLIHCAIDPEMNVYPMIPAGKMPQDLLMPGMEKEED